MPNQRRAPRDADGRCTRCGEIHLTKSGKPACVGHSSGTGHACKNGPKHGMTVCGMHGGRAGQVVAKAAERLQEQYATEQAAMLGLPREISAHDGLIEEVHRTAGMVAYYDSVIQSLERGDLKQRTFDGSGRGWERPSVWIELHQQERRHFLNACKVAIAAGVEERRVQLAEQAGVLIVTVLRGVIHDLGLDDDARVPAIVGRHLRAIDGGAAA